MPAISFTKAINLFDTPLGSAASVNVMKLCKKLKYVEVNHKVNKVN